MDEHLSNRILIVDDNQSIHEDFLKILPTADGVDGYLDDLLSDVLGQDLSDMFAGRQRQPLYRISHALQGKDGYEMALEAAEQDDPFSLIFMDMRMPPGWDGIQTIRKIWEKLPHTEVVICTAYSDYSWEDILTELGTSDQLQFLRKPFDVVSVKQMALALTRKWSLAQKARNYVDDLEREVALRTRELQEKLEEITQLQGILPMCSYCKKVRDDADYWQRVDEYISRHSEVRFSHCICPECYEKVNAELEAMEAGPRPSRRL